MDDYGAAQVKRATRRAGWLRGSLAVAAAASGLQAAMGLLSLVSEPIREEVMGFFGLAFLLNLLSSAVGVGWVYSSVSALERMGLQGSLRREHLFMLVGVFFCPCIGLLVTLLAFHQLQEATNPARLPPVVVEQESDGGFRQNAVVAVQTGAIARPHIWLWFVVTLTSNLLPSWLDRATHRAPGLSLAAVGVGYLSAALLARQAVGAISLNLLELQRRFAHQQSAAG